MPDFVISRILSYLDLQAVDNLILTCRDLNYIIDNDLPLWRRLCNSIEMKPFLANLTLHPSLYGMKKEGVKFWKNLTSVYKATREPFSEDESQRCQFLWQGYILFDQIFELERGFICGIPFTFSLTFAAQRRCSFIFSTKLFTVKTAVSAYAAVSGKFTKCFISKFPVFDVTSDPITLVVTSFPRASHDALTVESFMFTAHEIVKKERLNFTTPFEDAGIGRPIIASQGNKFAIGSHQSRPRKVSHIMIFLQQSSTIQLLQTLTYDTLNLQDIVFNLFDGSLLLKFWTELELLLADPNQGKFIRYRHLYLVKTASYMFTQTAIVYDRKLQSSVILLNRRHEKEIYLWYIDPQIDKIQYLCENHDLQDRNSGSSHDFVFSFFSNAALRLFMQEQTFFDDVIIEILELNYIKNFRRQVINRFLQSLRRMSMIVRSIYCEGLYCRGVLSSTGPGALQMSLSIHISNPLTDGDNANTKSVRPHHHLATTKK